MKNFQHLAKYTQPVFKDIQGKTEPDQILMQHETME